jgi:hypothetical protein
MRDIAVVQAQNANFAQGWTPVNYDWFFRIQDCQGGVDFDNIFLCAVTRGFYCYNSGRTDFRRIRGQVFTSGIEVDAALDVPRMSNIHFWPFWSADTNVMNYQQTQGDALVFKRADGPFIDQAFALGYRSMFRFSQGVSGWRQRQYRLGQRLNRRGGAYQHSFERKHGHWRWKHQHGIGHRRNRRGGQHQFSLRSKRGYWRGHHQHCFWRQLNRRRGQYQHRQRELFLGAGRIECHRARSLWQGRFRSRALCGRWRCAAGLVRAAKANDRCHCNAHCL